MTERQPKSRSTTKGDEPREVYSRKYPGPSWPSCSSWLVSVPGRSLFLQVKEPLQCGDIKRLVVIFPFVVAFYTRYRAVEHLIDHRCGHVFQRLLLLFRQFSKTTLERFFHFLAANIFEALAQRGDRRHLLKPVYPPSKVLHFFAYDLFSLGRLTGSLGQIFFGHAFQVVDIIKVDIVEFV